MTDKELYKKALDTWGIYAQTLVFHEEMAEVLFILKGFAQGDLVDELADVVIMTEQMMLNFHVKNDVNMTYFAINENTELSNLISNLEENYLHLNQTMSHYYRGRSFHALLSCDLRALWGWLMLIVIHHKEVGKLAFTEAKKRKLNRLAEMLDETYEAGE